MGRPATGGGVGRQTAMMSHASCGFVVDGRVMTVKSLRRARPGMADRVMPRPPRTLVELEVAVATWVHWFNHTRLMHRLGLIPPLEYEAAYYAATRSAKPASALTTECASKSG
jgi:transposase InsO family protein